MPTKMLIRGSAQLSNPKEGCPPVVLDRRLPRPGNLHQTEGPPRLTLDCPKRLLKRDDRSGSCLQDAKLLFFFCSASSDLRSYRLMSCDIDGGL